MYHLNNAGREQATNWWNAWGSEAQGGKDQQEHEDVLAGRYRLCVCAPLEHGSRRCRPRGGEVKRGRSFLDESS
jgi:hypothetical protein